MNCLDYALSYICGTAAFNNVRFWIESRTTLFDAQNKQSAEFYQCASCKSEDTFAKENLLYQDNYDFLPIFGGGDILVFRRPARISDRYREVKRAEEVWGKPNFLLRYPAKVTPLETFEQIRDATAAGIPIVSQTELTDAKTGLKAIIECPVKTMNINQEHRMYQVDSGPVAFADLTKRYERPIESLSLAFVVFNAPHFADFVIEQPTQVIEDGAEKCRIYHYSQPFSRPAANRLFALSPGH